MQELLHVALDKTNAIRCSNWEARPLTDVQKAYAATDAFAALAVYQVHGLRYAFSQLAQFANTE